MITWVSGVMRRCSGPAAVTPAIEIVRLAVW
jgi:hypothetical protein